MPGLSRTLSGFLAAADFSGVPDGTELHNFQNWKAFRSVGSPNGLFRIQDEEIESVDNVSYAMILWGDDSVKNPGHCIRGEVMSGNWNTLVPGLVANGTLDHAYDIRGILGNSWELATRFGTPGDYGEGFVIGTGTTPGQPLTNGAYYDFLVAAVQNPGIGFHNRGGSAYNNGTHIALNDTNLGLLSGLNDGSETYPGVYYFATGGARWRNLKVYTDYRLTVRGLTASQSFRLFDSGGSPVLDAPTQSGGETHVNIYLLTWPFTGYIQVYEDTTWATPVTALRFPSSGNDSNINGGDIYDVSSNADQAVQVNWDDAPNPPDEWTVPSNKDVTIDVIDVDVVQYAANPQITRDTATFILRDPLGKYVPARVTSPLYPNVKPGKWIRWVVTENGITKCRFVGKILEFQPVVSPPQSGGRREQQSTIRAESPIRELAKVGLTLVTLPSGVLVNTDGVTGVIPYLLSLVPDIIPPANWDLTPTPDTVESGFFESAKNFLTALQQCAILSNSIYFVEPQLRTSVPGVNWTFRWMPGDAQHDQVADHTWVDTDDDIHEFTPVRFTLDQI